LPFIIISRPYDIIALCPPSLSASSTMGKAIRNYKPVVLMISLLSAKLTIPVLHFALWLISYRTELCCRWLGNELEVLQKVWQSTDDADVVQCN